MKGTTEHDQYQLLIERIIRSEPFKAAPDQGKLLRFLYKHRERPLQAKQIEEEHYKFPRDHSKHDPGHSRERVADLKKRLRIFADLSPKEKWRCDLPDAERGEGYRLEFNPVERTASQLFWKAHADMAEDVIVVCASHLFFFDPEGSAIVRHYDFNVDDQNREETLKGLKALHPEVDVTHLEPWHSPYISTGEAVTHEMLLHWFHKESGVLIRRSLSRDLTDKLVQSSSPILLGRPQTNKFIGRIMDSPQAAHLAYRRHSARGTVKISGIKNEERHALEDYPVTEDGIVGPVPNWRAAFGIVTRLRNPSGYGFVTIIAGDYYAMVIARIAESMTNDKLARNLLAEMNWPADEDLPDSFEMLFSVTLSPGNLEGEGFPKLLCWRPYPKS
jgi:hypothetical protein